MKNIFLILFSSIYFFASCQTAEPETFIIPDGYKGKVMIVFEKPNGVTPKFERNRRIYEIPKSGILVTQFKINEGFMNRQFYYIDSFNQRIPIKYFKNEKEAELTSEVGIFYSGTAGVYGNSGDPHSVVYQEFIVSDYKSLNLFFNADYRKKFHESLKQAVGHDIK